VTNVLPDARAQTLAEQAHDWRKREVQAIGAAISTRSWHAVEQAYNSLRDKMDRAGCWNAPEEATPPASNPIDPAVSGLQPVAGHAEGCGAHDDYGCDCAPKVASEAEPCGYCGSSPCRCDRTDLCQAPGCDNPTDRGICDACDQWVSDQVASEAAMREADRALLERCQEELRLLRMKDTGAVYDIGLRSDLHAALHSSPSGASDGGEVEPVAWCSPGQLANLMDVDTDGGVYLPIRKTKRGNFTMPLYATTPGGDLLEQAARVGKAIEDAWNGSGSDGQRNDLPPIDLSEHERVHIGTAAIRAISPALDGKSRA
jgi:hypothetical protein